MALFSRARGFGPRLPTGKSFCFFFQKEVLFFFEKKNQKTFVCLSAWPLVEA
jgi:hypothetical protein